MASRKPKKDRRQQDQKRRRLKRLEHKPQPRPLGGPRLVIEPAGREKMSAVLEEFVEPYRGQTETEDEFRNLLHVGMLAWNAALLPDDQQREMIEQVLEAGLPGASVAMQKEARALVDALVQRKQAHFATNRRVIVSFQLTNTGREYHLLVAATL